MALRQTADGRWFVYYRVRGPDGRSRIKWESFGRGAEAEARAAARDSELGLLRRRPRREALGPSVLELARAYLQLRGLNENSRKQLGIRIAAHLGPHFGARPAVSLKFEDLDRYVAARRDEGVSDATICRELTDLKAILNWSARREPPLIPFNPVAAYPKPRPRRAVIQPPTRGEAAAILRHAPEHVRRALLLAWHLGLRPQGETLSLRWDSVDWERGRILIRSAHKGGPEYREVPIHPELLRQLRLWRAADAAAGAEHIVHYLGRAVRSIKRAWRAAVSRAGIRRRIRPYDFRHYFISRALEEGADLKAVSEVVGSAPGTLLRFYQHVTGRQHERAIRLIPGLGDISDPGPRRDRRSAGR